MVCYTETMTSILLHTAIPATCHCGTTATLSWDGRTFFCHSCARAESRNRPVPPTDFLRPPCAHCGRHNNSMTDGNGWPEGGPVCVDCHFGAVKWKTAMGVADGSIAVCPECNGRGWYEIEGPAPWSDTTRRTCPTHVRKEDR